ncbi:hypothetical protein GCM10008910_02780 [Faecalicatena orotica]|nr:MULTISPECIES: hypothetical protein [Clostridia]
MRAYFDNSKFITPSGQYAVTEYAKANPGTTITPIIDQKCNNT